MTGVKELHNWLYSQEAFGLLFLDATPQTVFETEEGVKAFCGAECVIQRKTFSDPTGHL